MSSEKDKGFRSFDIEDENREEWGEIRTSRSEDVIPRSSSRAVAKTAKEHPKLSRSQEASSTMNVAETRKPITHQPSTMVISEPDTKSTGGRSKVNSQSEPKNVSSQKKSSTQRAAANANTSKLRQTDIPRSIRTTTLPRHDETKDEEDFPHEEDFVFNADFASLNKQQKVEGNDDITSAKLDAKKPRVPEVVAASEPITFSSPVRTQAHYDERYQKKLAEAGVGAVPFTPITPPTVPNSPQDSNYPDSTSISTMSRSLPSPLTFGDRSGGESAIPPIQIKRAGESPGESKPVYHQRGEGAMYDIAYGEPVVAFAVEDWPVTEPKPIPKRPQIPTTITSHTSPAPVPNRGGRKKICIAVALLILVVALGVSLPYIIKRLSGEGDSNTSSSSTTGPPVQCIFVLNLVTDDFGSNISWSLSHSDTSAIVEEQKEGTLGNNKAYRKSILIDEGPYIFKINDSSSGGNGGDGIQKPGYYSLSLAGKEFARGGQFVNSESTEFFVTSDCAAVRPLFDAPSPTTSERVDEITVSPTARPTFAPTNRPTSSPTSKPTGRDTRKPTNVTQFPTPNPTSIVPTISPDTLPPTSKPVKTTLSPSQRPTTTPVKAPTPFPSNNPSRYPSQKPTKRPTKRPTMRPTRKPSRVPSWEPSRTRSQSPSKEPTKTPVRSPTKTPTRRPTKAPTGLPTKAPTIAPTVPATPAPTKSPTDSPTTEPPTPEPTPQPTNEPTSGDTSSPTRSDADNNSTVQRTVDYYDNSSEYYYEWQGQF